MLGIGRGRPANNVWPPVTFLYAWLFVQIVFEHLCDLCPCSKALGIKDIAALAIEDTVLHSPANCGTGEIADLTGITEGKFHVGYGFFRIPPQHYRQLLTGDIVIWAESTIAVTADNALSRSPDHRVRIPCIRSHICKWTATADGGSSLFVVEDLGQLSAGEVSIRGKLGGSNIVHQIALAGKPHSVIVLSACAHIQEGIDPIGRRGVCGQFDGLEDYVHRDLAAGHDEGVLAATRVHQLQLVALAVGGGESS